MFFNFIFQSIDLFSKVFCISFVIISNTPPSTSFSFLSMATSFLCNNNCSLINFTVSFIFEHYKKIHYFCFVIIADEKLNLP